MSTEPITSASDAAKRNLANARSNYNNSVKNPNLSNLNWDGSGFPFVDLTGLGGAFSKVAPVNGNNNSTVTNNTATTTQNINPLGNYKDYNKSLMVNSNVNASSPSNTDNSFVPKMTSGQTSEPPSSTMHMITGDNFQNILVEIAEAMGKFFQNIPAQINTMTDIANKSSMSLWKMLVSASQAAGVKAQQEMEKNIQSARDSAQAAGNCAMIAGIIEAVVAAVLVVISVAVAVAAAPFTAGASVGAVIVGISALVGVISSTVMVGDGLAKAGAGAELASHAQSATNIQELIDKYLPMMQHGVFAVFGKDAAMVQEIFTITTSVISILGSGAEMATAEAIEKGAEAVTKTFLQKLTTALSGTPAKIFSVLNSAVSIGGMIGGAVEDSKTGDSAPSEQTRKLWGDLSSGLMGAAVYLIFETSMGTGKTLEQRIDDTGVTWLATTIECATLLLLSFVSMGMEVLARSGAATPLGPNGPKILYRQMLGTLFQYGLQTAVSSGQVTIEVLMDYLQASTLEVQGKTHKATAELQLMETLINNVTAQNDQAIQGNMKLMSDLMQTYGAFLSSLKEAFNSQSKAIRANVA